MNSQPLVSVVIPVYNVEKYLEKCLQSVVSQSYTNLEIIIVDDGATDSSYLIYENFQAKDSRIKVVKQHNQGLSAARNTGIDNANGEYIAFVDSDDFVDKDFIRLLLDACLTNDVLLSFGGVALYKGDDKVIFIDDAPKIVDCKLEPSLLTDEFQNTAWRKLYHKSLLQDLRFPVGLYHEDIGFWFGIMSIYDKIAIVKEHLYYYRKNNAGSITCDESVKLKRCFDALKSFAYGFDMIEKYCLQDRFASLINTLALTYAKFPFFNNDKEWRERQLALLFRFSQYSNLLKFSNKRLLNLLRFQNIHKIKKHFELLLTCKKGLYHIVLEPFAIIRYSILLLVEFVTYCWKEKCHKSNQKI